MPAPYPPAGQITWVAGQRLDAADLNPWPPPRVGWGLVARATRSTNANNIVGGPTDLAALTVTFTAVADRDYRIVGDVHFDAVSGAAGANLQIALGDNTELRNANLEVTTSTDFHLVVEHVHTPGAGEVTYKLRATGGGSGVNMQASAQRYASIEVYDVGPAS